MRHFKRGRKLNRTAAHRKALLANLAASLLRHERIQTTTPKAKELRGVVDGLITLGKRGDLHARRLAIARVGDKEAVHRLFSDLAERYANRPGGYTRVLPLARRAGDNAPLSLVELVDAPAPIAEIPVDDGAGLDEEAGADV